MRFMTMIYEHISLMIHAGKDPAGTENE